MASMSFGALPHATILARASRRPDTAFFLSPLNTGMEYRAGGELVYWLSKQAGWLQYVLPFTTPSPPPGRASVWDIINTEKNLLPQIKGMSIAVVNGDSDLFFSQEGFAHFAAILEKTGNRVTRRVLPNSGHMVLLDNDESEVEAMIQKALGLGPQ